MNRNSLLKQRTVWHKLPDTSSTVATFTDDGSVPTFVLLEHLSQHEKEHAAGLHDPIELRHYIARRCFQRLFVCELLSTKIVPDKLVLIHQRDTQPHCADAPGLNLSFSSSGTTAIACASWHHAVGIDIERLREVENVIALAQRFFTSEEAAALANVHSSKQSLAFLHYWTAKEAGLKAIGKGIVFGLNTFRMHVNEMVSNEILGPQESSQRWKLQYFELLPQHLIALVSENKMGKDLACP